MGQSIVGNYIGTVAPRLWQPRRLVVAVTSPNTIIGGTVAADRNVIRATATTGADIGSDGNRVQGTISAPTSRDSRAR